MFEYFLLGLVGIIIALGWVVYFLSRKGKNGHDSPAAHQH